MIEAKHSARSDKKNFLEQVKAYDLGWTENLTVEENVEEDEEFLYLEVEDENDISGSFYELGWALDATSTGEVNNGERYVLSVEKQQAF